METTIAPAQRFTLPPVTRVVARTLSARNLNAVANHADVRPWLGGDGPLDLTALVENPFNFAFETAHGGFIGVAQSATRYEVHSLFLPEGRGAEAIGAMRSAAAYMFSATPCQELVTKVPQTNPAAAAMAKRAGFESAFMRSIPWSNDERVPVEFLGLSLERWAMRSTITAERGAWFHECLSATKAAVGSTLAVHDDDPVHDAMVGAAILMAAAGNGAKAVVVYNAWARFAGYAPITLVSEHPTVIDLQDAVVEASPTEMEILLCR